MSRLLILISLFAVIVYSQDFSTAAEKCCLEKGSCCLSKIRNSARVDCFEGDGERESTAADCLQKEIFGEKSLRFAAFGDTECCAIFDLDDNDVSGVCRSTCSAVMRSPSLSSKQKLDEIKNCRENNENYTCFRRCQLWLRGSSSQPSTTSVFPFHEHCNASALMKPGRVYLGEQLL